MAQTPARRLGDASHKRGQRDCVLHWLGASEPRCLRLLCVAAPRRTSAPGPPERVEPRGGDSADRPVGASDEMTLCTGPRGSRGWPRRTCASGCRQAQEAQTTRYAGAGAKPVQHAIPLAPLVTRVTHSPCRRLGDPPFPSCRGWFMFLPRRHNEHDEANETPSGVTDAGYIFSRASG